MREDLPVGQRDSEKGITPSASVSCDWLTMWAPRAGVMDENSGRDCDRPKGPAFQRPHPRKR